MFVHLNTGPREVFMWTPQVYLHILLACPVRELHCYSCDRCCYMTSLLTARGSAPSNLLSFINVNICQLCVIFTLTHAVLFPFRFSLFPFLKLQSHLSVFTIRRQVKPNFWFWLTLMWRSAGFWYFLVCIVLCHLQFAICNLPLVYWWFSFIDKESAAGREHFYCLEIC